MECPSCCANVFDELINSHLDVCAQEVESDKAIKPIEEVESKRLEAKSTTSTTETLNTPNAFSHMMQQAKKLSRGAAQQCHVNLDYTLSWSDAKVGCISDEAVAWSTTIQLRNNDNSKSQLTLSTSIPEQRSPLRLVQRHSRLSVPVLKSILQKSVRRRRPLPATRVAMELIDKALGPFLRRMPIIILEDSTLHPDFSLLCWLMAAESKGYKVPLELISRVLQVVYEVSSCPWTDSVDIDDAMDRGNEIVIGNSISDVATVTLKCMAMRASYGGMKCDMEMLQKYRITWGNRFAAGIVPVCVSERLGESACANWVDVPDLIHSKTRHLAIQHTTSMMQRSLLELQLRDVCIEGIDFHCSDVLEQLIKDDAFVSRSCDRLKFKEGTADMKRKEQLLVVLQQCMWRYSSGVNLRQSLLGDRGVKEDDQHLKLFWQDLAAPRVHDLMMRYVTSRLSNYGVSR